MYTYVHTNVRVQGEVAERNTVKSSDDAGSLSAKAQGVSGWIRGALQRLGDSQQKNALDAKFHWGL